MTNAPNAENITQSAQAAPEGNQSEPAELVPSAFSWDSLDVHGARQLWEDLTEWVDWLRYTYQLESRIKPCWYRHSAVREELTALMVAHKAVYMTEPAAVGTYREDLISWHTQWYRDSLEALVRLLADCSRDHCAHILAPPRVPVEDPERKKFIDEDVQRHAGPAESTTGNPQDLPHPAHYSEQQMQDAINSGAAVLMKTPPESPRHVSLDQQLWTEDPSTGNWTTAPQG
ncbi:hypothetical protein [Nocardia noduli]|uniref:hypothetical protein n=1 Tax=Nocardia noduli TaxID=2815722 RepID=UPI001C24FBBD|nr:hypothetical protein [Nocardia noduli]